MLVWRSPGAILARSALSSNCPRTTLKLVPLSQVEAMRLCGKAVLELHEVGVLLPLQCRTVASASCHRGARRERFRAAPGPGAACGSLHAVCGCLPLATAALVPTIQGKRKKFKTTHQDLCHQHCRLCRVNPWQCPRHLLVAKIKWSYCLIFQMA